MKKILIVEDDVFIARLLETYLQTHQFDTILVQNGFEAIRLAQLEQPNLILLDMRLPHLDGWQTASTLKQHPQTSEIPIIAMSVATTQAEQKLGIENGCAVYLTKPIILSELLATINRFLPNE